MDVGVVGGQSRHTFVVYGVDVDTQRDPRFGQNAKLVIAPFKGSMVKDRVVSIDVNECRHKRGGHLCHSKNQRMYLNIFIGVILYIQSIIAHRTHIVIL